MSNYLDRINSQPLAVTILSSLLKKNRIPNALLFIGPKGTGKHFTALQFAKELNANHITQKSSILKKISSLDEPYIKYVIPLPRGKSEDKDDSPTNKLEKEIIETINEEVAKKVSNPYYEINIEYANNIKISSIRNIRKYLSLNYDEIGYRIILINDAHLMSDESQNALLKSLEEPPPKVVFILLTHNDDFLLPTIVSRCQKVFFNPLSSANVKTILKDYFHIDENDSELVSNFCNGSVSNAARLIHLDFSNLIDKTINVLRYSLANKYSTALTIINKLIEDYGESIVRDLLAAILKWFDDVLKNRAGFTDYFYKDQTDTIIKFNQRFPNSSIHEIQYKIDNFLSLMDRNMNLNLILLNTIFEIGHIGIRK